MSLEVSMNSPFLILLSLYLAKYSAQLQITGKINLFFLFMALFMVLFMHFICYMCYIS